MRRLQASCASRAWSAPLSSAAGGAWPSHPSELHAPWLTSTLRAAGALSPSESVTSFHAVTLGSGVGLASLLQRLTCTVSTAGAAPRTLSPLIIKFPPTDPEAQLAATQLRAFARECGFYNALRGAAASAAATAPACYFSEHEERSGRACLLLEDMGGDGWRGGDQVAGASLPLAQAVLSTAAAQHAAFWGDEARLRPWVNQGWLPALDGPSFAAGDSSAELFGPAWPRWQRRYPAAAGLLPPALRALLDARPGSFSVMVAEPLLRRLGAAPRTLLHGDLRLDNVMWRGGGGEGAGKPETRHLDMGDCAVGRGAFDVAYFLSMSLETEVREQHEAQLLELYGEKLREGGVKGYSGEELRGDYEAGCAYSLALAVTLGGGEKEPDQLTPRRALLAAAVAQRAAAAYASRL